MKKVWSIVLTGIVLVGLILFYYSPLNKEAVVTEVVPLEEEPEAEPTLYYGIPIASFEVVTGKVKWHQNLSGILDDYTISSQMMFEN